MKTSKILSALVVVLLLSLLIQPAAAQSIAIALTANGAIVDYVDAEHFSKLYRFTAMADRSMFLMTVSQDYHTAPSVLLIDDMTSDSVAALKMGVSGVCLRISPGTDSYSLRIIANSATTPQIYGIALASGAPANMTCSENMATSLSDTMAAGIMIDTADSGSMAGIVTINTGTGASSNTGGGSDTSSASSLLDASTTINDGTISISADSQIAGGISADVIVDTSGGVSVTGDVQAGSESVSASVDVGTGSGDSQSGTGLVCVTALGVRVGC